MVKVGIVGATGIVGQQALMALLGHKWFEVSALVASPRSAGKPYQEALKGPNGDIAWWGSPVIPEEYGNMTVISSESFDPESVDMVFSTMESGAAKELEPKYARTTPVVSTASAFRYEPDVPILIGGINMKEHAPLIEVQKKKRNWKGFVIPKPNCTTAGMVLALKPVMDCFGVEQATMTSLQAISGAGRTPGVGGMDILDNVVPYIAGEEPKAASEPQKILGTYENESITHADFPVHATCFRVPVIDGHTVSVVVKTKKKPDLDALYKYIDGFGKDFLALNLPSSPERLIEYTLDPYRPQPRLDRERGDGMTVTMGRMEVSDTFENTMRFICLSHNTKYGAAKGLLQTAEYLAKEYLQWVK